MGNNSSSHEYAWHEKCLSKSRSSRVHVQKSKTSIKKYCLCMNLCFRQFFLFTKRWVNQKKKILYFRSFQGGFRELWACNQIFKCCFQRIYGLRREIYLGMYTRQYLAREHRKWKKLFLVSIVAHNRTFRMFMVDFLLLSSQNYSLIIRLCRIFIYLLYFNTTLKDESWVNFLFHWIRPSVCCFVLNCYRKWIIYWA